FRSRSRVYDESSGQWISETETIETASELVEIYNPADILQAFADAEAEDATGAADPYAAAADQWAAGQPEVREAHDEQTAALALYELALDFQDRSQRTEASLIAGFENAGASALGYIGNLVIVEDDDENLSLGAGGFRGKV